MIGWWLMGEMLQRRSPWTIPNLLATTFYGERAYRPGFIVPTWAGLAEAFAVYCAAGILFAVAGRERKGGWLLLLVGVAAGLSLDWFNFGVVLKRLNPLVQIYSPDQLIAVSHLLYGAALASYPGFARQLQSVGESGPDPDLNAPDLNAPDLSASGFSAPNDPGAPVPPPIPDTAAPELPVPERPASEQSASDQ